MRTPKRHCQFVRDDGAPCNRPPRRGEDWCPAHDPAGQAEWSEHCRRAGGAPHSPTARGIDPTEELQVVETHDDLMMFLNQVAFAVAGGAISSGQGVVLSSLASTMLKVMESNPKGRGDGFDFASVMRAVTQRHPELMARLEENRVAIPAIEGATDGDGEDEA